MKRLLFAFVMLLAATVQAAATALLTLTVTTAQTAQVSSIFQLRGSPGQQPLPTNILVQCNFTYGSGGTSADAWLQTTVDGGVTWIDVANFHFTTSTARFVYNLSSATALTTEYTPTDGTLAANTSKDGIVGSMWRVKYTTVGTYAASTTLRLDVFTNGITPFP